MVNSVTFSSGVGGDGSTVTDDDNVSTGLGNGGHLLRFIPCLQNVVAIAGTVVTKAGEALTSASAAAGSATAASSSASAASGSASAAAASAADAQPKPILTYANLAAFPATGVGGRVYQALDSAFFYVWDAGAYVRTYHSLSALTIAELNAAVTDADLATTTDVANASISNIVTATTKTTLTAIKTLLKITPTGYGVPVILPNATTCALGGPLHIVDNEGAYPIKIFNASGTLLGFVLAGVVSHISLIDKSTSAGVWSIENNQLVGGSAQLLTANLAIINSCIPLDSNRELISGCGADAKGYAVVYDKSTNNFGPVTQIRNASISNTGLLSILAAADKVLCVSCTNGSTAFEAVILSIDPSTNVITPNSPVPATLSANISAFADGCGLIQVGTSFITSYTVATPAAQIREITVSGTTPTISAATVLDGTAGGLIVAGDATHVIAVSTATTHLYTKPYAIGGLSAGTGTDTNSGTMTLNKLAALGTRWFVGYNDGGSTVKGAVVSLSGTTTTISAATVFSAGTLQDAIVVEANKVLMLNNQTGSHINILTDTAGTASAGTAISAGGTASTRACLYVSGTSAFIQSGTTLYGVFNIDCSGSSPVANVVASGIISNTEIPVFSASNAMLSRSADAIYSANYIRSIVRSAATVNLAAQVRGGRFNKVLGECLDYTGNTPYRGKTDSERWVTDGSTIITKVECVQ